MRQTQLCAHMHWGVQGGLHTVCVRHRGGWQPVLGVCGLLERLGRGLGDGSLSVQRCVQRCPCVPSQPQGPRAAAGAGADALSRCSTAPLPGEGSTAPGKGELILGPYPAGISAATPPLGHCLGSLECLCSHRIA